MIKLLTIEDFICVPIHLKAIVVGTSRIPLLNLSDLVIITGKTFIPKKVIKPYAKKGEMKHSNVGNPFGDANTTTRVKNLQYDNGSHVLGVVIEDNYGNTIGCNYYQIEMKEQEEASQAGLGQGYMFSITEKSETSWSIGYLTARG